MVLETPAVDEDAGRLPTQHEECESGDAKRCLELARAATVLEERIAFAERACALGEGLGCTMSATAHLGLGRLEDARSQFERGCGLDDALACTLLGEAYWHGPAASLVSERDRKKARQYHEKAWAIMQRKCDEEDASSCASVGLAYLSGRTAHNEGAGVAVQRSVEQGRAALHKACTLGDGHACITLSDELRGEHPDRADGLLQRACPLTHSSRCETP
jgi:TPR repeat protein